MGVITITTQNFEAEVLQSEKPVLLDFWASWCAPCRQLSPIVDAYADANPDIKVGKINIDEQNELTVKYKVMSVPTLVVMKGGELTDKSVGVIPIEQIDALVRGKSLV